MWTVFGWVFVHVADHPFFAVVVQKAAVLLQNAVDFGNYRTVEWIGSHQCLHARNRKWRDIKKISGE